MRRMRPGFPTFLAVGLNIVHRNALRFFSRPGGIRMTTCWRLV